MQLVNPRIEVKISEQKLYLFDGENLVKTYLVSTASAGIGCQKNSFQTPIGKHYIRAKIGADAPADAVFVARRPTGEIYSADLAEQFPARDWILTRILWLSGLEVGKNRLGEVDTMQRFVYIHGAPASEPMGVPASQGCVRLHTPELIELFDLVKVGTEVNLLA